MDKENTMFEKALNFEIPKDKIETIKDKNSGSRPLSYVSWAYAWGIFKQLYPDATYRIIKNPQTNLPYFYDENAGIMVYTEITANNETHEMWLFVMDASNQAMRLTPYEYQKWNSYEKHWETKGVKAATMFEINKTLLRCLVKNMAIFGFGLNIYNGDDLPEFNIDSPAETPTTQPKRTTRKTSAATATPAATQQTDRYSGIRMAINATKTTEELLNLYNSHKIVVDSDSNIRALFTQRKNELMNKPHVA